MRKDFILIVVLIVILLAVGYYFFGHDKPRIEYRSEPTVTHEVDTYQDFCTKNPMQCLKD